jgi:hypothetical protein
MVSIRGCLPPAVAGRVPHEVLSVFREKGAARAPECDVPTNSDTAAIHSCRGFGRGGSPHKDAPSGVTWMEKEPVIITLNN